MKMNWGLGIAIFYIAFVIATVGVVLFTTTIDVNLVTDDYYEKELAFQNQIDKVTRTKSLPEQPVISLAGKNMYLKFPNSINSNMVEGIINFYRPSNNSMDFAVPIDLNQHGEQIVNSARFTAGMWRIYVDWKIDGINYLSEKILMVQ
ncbi:MAG: hypothetical protein HND52_04470 [Ignavibacteriae bacterium]|nr:hypothetical protein [Ignavibacteriota bacterium]NOG97213.1 hypothetical protein [Ignavibacteriota bacterium]